MKMREIEKRVERLEQIVLRMADFMDRFTDKLDVIIIQLNKMQASMNRIEWILPSIDTKGKQITDRRTNAPEANTASEDVTMPPSAGLPLAQQLPPPVPKLRLVSSNPEPRVEGDVPPRTVTLYLVKKPPLD